MIASTSQHMHHLVQQVEQLKAQSGVQRVAEFLASLSVAKQGTVRNRSALRQGIDRRDGSA